MNHWAPESVVRSICRVCGSPGGCRKTSLHACDDVDIVGDFTVLRCGACGNAFTHPDPPPDAYELRVDLSRTSSKAPRGIAMSFLTSRRVAKLGRVLGEGPRTILDIGGGACAFANALAHEGHRVTVVEPNAKNAEFADVSRGVTFVAASFGEQLLHDGRLKAQSFDAVTLWHALEHVPRPGETLEQIRYLLKPDGIVFFSVPRFDSLLARLGGNRWAYLDVPHHLSHFTTVGIDRLLRSTGFQHVLSYGFSIEYDLFGWFQTLLNLLTNSHNYFYNRFRKGRKDVGYLPHPRWTRWALLLSPLILIVAAFGAGLAAVVGSSACLEQAWRWSER